MNDRTTAQGPGPKRDPASRDHHPVDTNRSFADFLGLSVKGFFMGIADVIPGISGGTIAFMLEIYEDLLTAIKSFDLNFARLLLTGRFRDAFGSVAWRFLGAVLFGIGCAILLLSRLVSWLITHHPVLINAFFFGLILMTVPIIAKVMRRWTLFNAALLAASTVGTFFFVQLVPVSTPESPWFIFLCGAVAICAMILPGISGSFILLLLGKYQFIMDAVHQRDLAVIAVFVAGIVVGILSFVRVLGWLFSRYHDATIAILTGFVLGSLNKIWPWKETLETIVTDHGKVLPIREVNGLPPALDAHFAAAAGLCVLGCAVAFALHAIPQKHLNRP